jgi:hypothetical protein
MCEYSHRDHNHEVRRAAWLERTLELGVGLGMAHIRWLWIGYEHITNVTHSICIGRLLSSMNSAFFSCNNTDL